MTCLKMAYVQVETCSIHIKVTLIQIDFCFFRMNVCDLCSTEHNGMAAIQITELHVELMLSSRDTRRSGEDTSFSSYFGAK